MFIKHKTLTWILFIALSLLILYTGISCIAMLCKADTQPYLMSGAVRYDFMGYYILSACSGTVCLLSAAALLLILITMKKQDHPSMQRKSPSD